MFDVTVLGSANIDLVAATDRLPSPGETVLGHDYDEFPGGKGLNQAVAAARVGARVAFVGAVGGDDAGGRLVRLMADEVIDTERVDVVADAPTGRALITVDARAQNCIVVVPGANAEVTGDHIPPSKVVLAQLEVPLAAVTQAFRAARSAGSLTVLNPAPAAPLPDELLRLTDIIVPNEHEAELLGGAAALRERGVDVVVVTRGAAGVTVLERDTAWNRPALSVTAVDTTAAGDAFCGVLAARLAAGAPLAAAVEWASAGGAHAATIAGATPSLPTGEQVEALLVAGG